MRKFGASCCSQLSKKHPEASNDETEPHHCQAGSNPSEKCPLCGKPNAGVFWN